MGILRCRLEEAAGGRAGRAIFARFSFSNLWPRYMPVAAIVKVQVQFTCWLCAGPSTPRPTHTDRTLPINNNFVCCCSLCYKQKAKKAGQEVMRSVSEQMAELLGHLEIPGGYLPLDSQIDPGAGQKARTFISCLRGDEGQSKHVQRTSAARLKVFCR